MPARGKPRTRPKGAAIEIKARAGRGKPKPARATAAVKAAAAPRRERACAAVRALGHVEALVNPLSGSVGAGAAQELADILETYGVKANITEMEADHVPQAVEAAIKAKPDLVITLAGDGTANLAARLCGPDGPLVAPLAGGTMNMLPFAVYGHRPWQKGLIDTLKRGKVVEVSGGEVGGLPFYVAAILGEPAMLAHAREAVRRGKPLEAIRRVRDVYRKAFSSRLRFALDGQESMKTEALALISPLISKALSDQKALEAAILDPSSAAEVFRLGVRTLFSDVLGDWRTDPSVRAFCMRDGEAWASGRIPAILDGEPVRLAKRVKITFVPVAFKALAAMPKAPAKTKDAGKGDKVEAEDKVGASA